MKVPWQLYEVKFVLLFHICFFYVCIETHFHPDEGPGRSTEGN